MDNDMKRLMKKKSLALKVLKGIGMAGLVIIAATSPYFGLSLVKDFKKRKNWQKCYKSLNYLNERDYVEIVRENGGYKAKITSLGKQMLRISDTDSIQIKDKKIDGRWRIVIFDVPIKKSARRMAFIEKLKNLDFIMVQKSVWASPYECRKEIYELRKFYEIDRNVIYLETSGVEDELSWKKRFENKLKSNHSPY